MFKHRGISHEHILGTVTRVLFMGLKILAPHCERVFLGLIVADSMHTAADGRRKQREHTE